MPGSVMDIPEQVDEQMVTSESLSDYIENMLSIIPEQTNGLPDWPEDALSDHLPVYGKVRGINIITFNVLNPRWLHYITDDNGQGQNLKHCKFVEMENRMLRIYLMVLSWIKSGYIVCLQEVDNNLFRLLRSNSSVISYVSNTIQHCNYNRNVIVWSETYFERKTDDRTDRSDTDMSSITKAGNIWKFFSKTKNRSFYLQNVHISYGKNRTYIELIQKFLLKLRVQELIICGDFNATSRRLSPDVEYNEPITVYPSNFHFLKRTTPTVYTHCNRRENVPSEKYQMDVFDYICVLRPNPDTV